MSYHYLPPGPFSDADRRIIARVAGAFEGMSPPVLLGATWTTDAPYRETAESIARRTDEGLLAVEMEAAALYAFAQARRKVVLCFAQ